MFDDMASASIFIPYGSDLAEKRDALAQGLFGSMYEKGQACVVFLAAVRQDTPIIRS
jgi:hypothetical protein